MKRYNMRSVAGLVSGPFDLPSRAELSADQLEWERRRSAPKTPASTPMPCDRSDFAPRPDWRTAAANQQG